LPAPRRIGFALFLAFILEREIRFVLGDLFPRPLFDLRNSFLEDVDREREHELPERPTF